MIDPLFALRGFAVGVLVGMTGIGGVSPPAAFRRPPSHSACSRC